MCTRAPGHLLHSVPKNELVAGMRLLLGGSHKRTEDKHQGPQMCCSLKACCELSPLLPAPQPCLCSLSSFEGHSHGKAVCFWMMGFTRGMQQLLDEPVLQGQDVDTEGKDTLKLFCH